MKILKHILIWSFIAGYLMVILSFVDKEQDNILCRQIEIKIHDSLEVGFVTPQRVMSIINPDPATLLGKPVQSINISELEDKLHQIRAIHTVEVYYTVDGQLLVDIRQRIPIARIIDQGGASFCIDPEGYLIPMKSGYVPHIIVVNGNITSISKKTRHISESDNSKLLEEIYNLCQYLNQDPFFRAQIVQVYINDKEEIELIPRVGSHVILLGEPDGYEDKLSNLKVLYDQGFSSIGWNQFELINLKYENQVICTKR